MSKPQNNERIGAWIGLLMALVGLAAVFLPAMLGADMMGSGYALGWIGVFVVIIGLVTTWLFGVRARIMDRILAGKEILARWTYDDTQGYKQIEIEFERSKGRNRAIYLTMVFWFILIGGVFVAIDYLNTGEVSRFFVVLFFGLLGILGVVALLTPIFWRWRAARASRDVVISRNGLVMNGALHTWTSPFERLSSVKFLEGPRDPALVFSIRQLSRIGVTYETLIVPVPAGEQEAARQVASSLSRKP